MMIQLTTQKKMLSLAICSLLLIACDDDSKDLPMPAVAEAKPLDLTVLHINDSHSHLDEESTSLKLETANGVRESISVNRGGFARVTALINSLNKTVKNPVKIHSGDAITGDLYFNLTEGKADADLMNTVCFDTFTLGNHEFDNRDNGLKKFLGFLANSSCKTQALSANVKFGASSALKDSALVKPSTILERDGQKIGFIGVTISGKTKNASRPNDDTQFLDEAESAQTEIDRLKAQGINKIILQSHLGYQQDQALAKKLSGVDVIIGGDSHSLLGPQSLSTYGLTPEGDYPTRTTDKDGKPVCITQAWQYSYVVGKLNVSFDKNGDVSNCNGTPYILLGEQFRRAAVGAAALSAAEISSIKADISKSNILKIVSADQYTLDVLAPFKAAKDALALKQVALANDNLCLRRIPGTKRDITRSALGDICNQNPRVNAQGGDIQQVVAEAFLLQGKQFFNADISIQNGGGVRIDLPKGPVTVGNIYTVLPFKNTLVQLKVTGQEVKDTLEDAIDGVVSHNNSGSYPYTGGLRWEVDLNKAKGQRISNLQLRNAAGGYQALDLSKTYTIVTINFLADGQDFYSTLKSITGDRRIDVGLDYAEAFLNYVDTLPGSTGSKPLALLPLADYSTQKFTDTP